jgi:hypothetical protein
VSLLCIGEDAALAKEHVVAARVVFNFQVHFAFAAFGVELC